MGMNEFRIAHYIKKFQALIVLLSLAVGVLFYMTLQKKQNYTASVVIQYSNAQAAQGLAPDNTEIDVSEIYSSQVMMKVMERMGLGQDKHNLDGLRSRVKVKELLTDEMKAVKEAKNELGEVIEDKPTEYIISFTATREDSAKTAEFAREVLDNMLDIYLTNYSEQHINSTAIVNDVSNLYEHNYDYLEMAEILEKSVKNAIDSISAKTESRYDFRSSATGYSFDDLYYGFSLLAENEIPSLYAYILNNRITKDHAVLIAKYENRVKDFYLKNNASDSEIEGIKGVISSYVNMMRESGNTGLTYEYILDDVHDNFELNQDETLPQKRIDQTTQYDLLLKDYVKERSAYEDAVIETAFCQYILDIYTGRADLAETGLDGTDANAQGEAASAPAEDQAAAGSAQAEGQAAAGNVPARNVTDGENAQAEAYIKEIVSEVNNLFEVLTITNEEYNEYAGAANINLMTNIVVTENVKLLLYTGIAVILAAVVLSVVAVLAGRIEDIADYYMYRDHKFGISNRAAIDKYMNDCRGRLLDKDFCCVVFQMKNIQEKNSVFGRQATDEMMKKFLDFVAETFPKRKEGLLGINSLGQFLYFVPKLPAEHAKAYLKEISKLIWQYNKMKELKIDCEMKFAQAEAEGVYNIHDLMLCAMRSSPFSGEDSAGAKAVRDIASLEGGEEKTDSGTAAARPDEISAAQEPVPQRRGVSRRRTVRQEPVSVEIKGELEQPKAASGQEMAQLQQLRDELEAELVQIKLDPRNDRGSRSGTAQKTDRR